jgi:hypothetical protein
MEPSRSASHPARDGAYSRLFERYYRPVTHFFLDWDFSLEERTYLLVREARRPRADVGVVDLQPSGEGSTNGGEVPKDLAGDGPFFLVLTRSLMEV